MKNFGQLIFKKIILICLKLYILFFPRPQYLCKFTQLFFIFGSQEKIKKNSNDINKNKNWILCFIYFLLRERDSSFRSQRIYLFFFILIFCEFIGLLSTSPPPLHPLFFNTFSPYNWLIFGGFKQLPHSPKTKVSPVCKGMFYSYLNSLFRLMCV